MFSSLLLSCGFFAADSAPVSARETVERQALEEQKTEPRDEYAPKPVRGLRGHTPQREDGGDPECNQREVVEAAGHLVTQPAALEVMP